MELNELVVSWNVDRPQRAPYTIQPILQNICIVCIYDPELSLCLFKDMLSCCDSVSLQERQYEAVL